MNHLKEKLGKYLYDLVHDAPVSGFSLFRSVFLALLEFLSLIYRVLAWTKRSLYQYGLLKSHKLACPVISLGNITLGGTGKTPTAKQLALFIRDMGFRVAVLNRGYRASYKGAAALVSDGVKTYLTVEEAGDEAYLLAKSLPGVMVVIGADRAAAGRHAIEKHGAQAIIVDDGYQHWRLKRDLDIVLIDTLNQFGNKHTLPRGTLREPLACLDRADVFLLTKTNQSPKPAQNAVKDELKKYNPMALIVESSHKPGGFTEINAWLGRSNGSEWPRETAELPFALQNNEVLAFSALGNPASFEQTLHSLGVKTAAFVSYPDHHHYTADEMLQMTQKALDINAAALVTTEKDAVKIPEEFLKMQKMPVYVLPVEVVFHAGGEELAEAVRLLFAKKPKR